MNKKVIIISILGLVGVGVYLYFNNKSKTNKTLVSNLPVSEIPNLEQSQESIKIKQDIKDLATSIKAKRDATIVLQSQMKPNNFLPNRAFNSAISNNIINIQNTINLDVAKLKELGYTELNGSAVKIA
jgi:hypothetical protein